MTKNEKDEMIYSLLEAKFKSALDTLAKCTTIKGFYLRMCKQGYTEQMKCFRSIVLYTIMLHPDWKEDQIINHLSELLAA